MVKNPPVNTGDLGGAVFIPESRKPLGVGNSIPLKYSCLENSIDRGGWLVRVARSLTQLSTQAHTDTQKVSRQGKSNCQ